MCKGSKQQEETVRGSEVGEQTRGGVQGGRDVTWGYRGGLEPPLHLQRLWISTWRGRAVTAIEDFFVSCRGYQDFRSVV